jgi:DNA-binding CsgD family transcriptional regulator
MKEEIKNECYLLSLEGYQGKEIAEKLNLSPSSVSKAIASVTKGNDYQLAVKGCGVLLQEFVRYQDYCRKKLKELNEIKTEDNKEKLAIIKLQTDLYKDLLTIGSQGEFIQAVNKFRSRIKELESEK